MKTSRFLIFTVFLLVQAAIHAQVNNQLLYDQVPVHNHDSGSVGFTFYSFNYLRNTEYFNNIELGRTLLGYQVLPKIFFQAGKNVRIEGGVFVRRDFGGIEPFTEAQPFFSVKGQKGPFSLTVGNLEGTVAHQLWEPMFDIARVIEKRMEQGIQLKVQDQQTFADLWIDWNRFIERNSPYQEEFAAGFHAKRNLLKSTSSWKFSPDFQMLGKHRGGQIDTTHALVLMRWNLAFGALAEKQITSTKSAYFNASYHVYSEPEFSGLFPFGSGSGVLVNGGYRWKKLTSGFTYWEGNNYLAPIGCPIYASQSIDNAKHTESNRRLLFVRVIYDNQLFNSPLYFSLRFEPVYDLNLPILDYSYSLYIIYRGEWAFKQKKKGRKIKG